MKEDFCRFVLQNDGIVVSNLYKSKIAGKNERREEKEKQSVFATSTNYAGEQLTFRVEH